MTHPSSYRVTSGLLPCPFCGGKPIWQETQGGQAVNFDPVWRVNCSECYRIDMPWWSDKIDCIKQWNARTGPAAQTPVYADMASEPVAWRVKNDFGHWYVTADKRVADTYRDIEKLEVQPLYLGAAQPPMVRALELLEERPAAALRALVIEECAKVLDRAAQDWHRIRDPGMANNAKSYARQIRALSLSSTDVGGGK